MARGSRGVPLPLRASFVVQVPDEEAIDEIVDRLYTPDRPQPCPRTQSRAPHPTAVYERHAISRRVYTYSLPRVADVEGCDPWAPQLQHGV